MKKLLSIIIGIALIAIICYKTILTPHLIGTANKLTKLIVKQEETADCTCWSTVRIMEFHQTEIPLSYHATALKIEVMKNVLWSVWQTSSTTADFDATLNKIFNKKQSWLTSVNEPTTPENLLEKTQKYHYHRLTEHYRYLLSIIYDIAKNNLNPKELKELNHHQIKQLASISTHLNSELLQLAKVSALKNHHPVVTVEDIQFSYQSILKTLELSDKKPSKIKSSPLYFFWLKKISKTIAKNKSNALKKYNDSIWTESVSTQHQAKLLSKIFKTEISDKELVLLINDFIDKYRYLFYPINALRIDTLQKPVLNQETLNKTDFGYQIISFEEQFNQLLQTFPFLLHKNGDIEIKFKNRQRHQKKKQLHHYKIRSYTLDSVRDTIIHWTIIDYIQQNYRTAILDPFALELLAERISEYMALILTIAKENQNSIHEEFQKNTVKSFLQINDIKTSWTHKNTLEKKDYFKEMFQFKTSRTKKRDFDKKGYYSGITTVDINSDNKIDIIVPEETALHLYLNQGTGFKKVNILKNTGQIVRASYAIDFNSDYKLDIIAILDQEIIFLEQKSKTEFSKVNNIPMQKAFSMCTNDLDGDGDLDFYVTQIFSDEPALGGKNGEKNKIILNSNQSFEIADIPSSESKGIGLACSIIDVNKDNQNDIVIINDFGKDELLIQEKKLYFIDKARQYKFDDAGSGMNLSIIDFNHDDYWDIYITMIDMFNKHLTFQLPSDDSIINRSDKILKTNTYLIGNQLYLGKKNNFTRKTHDIFEPGNKGWGWGASFFDINNNSYNDVYITNGRFNLESSAIDDEQNILMINQKDRYFFSHSSSKESKPLNSRAVAAFDYDNNGLMDLALRTPYRVYIFKNTLQQKNKWIKIKLIGKKPNTYAIGSTIEIKTNSKSQKKIMLPETGYLSQEPYIKHFGLGNEDIQEITITWPNKTISKIKAPFQVNRIVTIHQEK